jgi:endo-alpha-1,4-polygalactosaminidase (GH114 family)
MNTGNKFKAGEYEMKYGIYVAYWLNEWAADYKKYIDKAAALGFDILETMSTT